MHVLYMFHVPIPKPSHFIVISCTFLLDYIHIHDFGGAAVPGREVRGGKETRHTAQGTLCALSAIAFCMDTVIRRGRESSH